MDSLYNKYKNFVSDIADIIDNENIIINKIISENIPSSKKIDRKRHEYNFDRELKFNFFTSISDIYYRENFHSDILKHTLDPCTDVIGNKLYIDIFVDILNDLKNNGKLEYFHKDVTKVSREEGRIDILIEDDCQSIIIESKINYAADQENQLARYVEYLKNKNITAVVYLTPVPGMRPDFNYSKEYTNYKFDIQEKLICLPILDNKGISLVHNYLDECIKQTENVTAKVYLEQYSQLLKHLGGQIMTKEFSKKILEDIYSSQEKISAAMNIVEIWKDERGDLLTEIIRESIKNTDISFQDHSEYGGAIFKKIDDDISVGFACTLCFGFISSPGRKIIKPEIKNNLTSILENENFIKYSGKIDYEDKWVYREVNIDTNLTIKELTDLILSRLKNLEELYLKSQRNMR